MYAADGYKFEGVVRKGDILISPAGQPTSWRLDDEGDALGIMLQPAFLHQVASESMGMNPDRVELLSKGPLCDPWIAKIGNSLLDELQSGGSGTSLNADRLGLALAGHLLKHYLARPPAEAVPSERLPDRRLQKALSRIQDNLGDSSLSLAVLAKEAHLSESHFCHAFKKTTGWSPHRYLIRQRIERAKQLLRGSSESLFTIAFRVGFADASHLSRHFKRIVRVTPGQYRESTR
jgi:AraC family transcriptional regulator